MHVLKNVLPAKLIDILCLQALLNNSYLYHMAHGKDFESRGIESKMLRNVGTIIYLVHVEIFHYISENFVLLVTLKEKSEDHQSVYD